MIFFLSAVLIDSISVMGGIQKEFFNTELRKVCFMEKKECRKESISCREARSKRGNTGRSLWESEATYNVEVVAEEITFQMGVPIPSYNPAGNAHVR